MAFDVPESNPFRRVAISIDHVWAQALLHNQLCLVVPSGRHTPLTFIDDDLQICEGGQAYGTQAEHVHTRGRRAVRV